MIYIVDIDGTIADVSHRLSFLKTEPKDWSGFFVAAVDDKPIWEVITVVRALHSAGNTIVIMTGRSESSRALTRLWLSKYRVPFHTLLMRTEGDHREDYVIKAELLKAYRERSPEDDIGGAFEDRQQNVDMFREKGIRVFHVAKGDY